MVLCLPSLALAAPATTEHPNIVLILADDVGLGNIHCYGGAFATPNIDQLAAEGTRFTYCYATPLCGPSRFELLTGRYPFRTGLISNKNKGDVSPKREVMIPSVLKTAGYVTCSIGKWGQIASGPGAWGFDEYLVFPGSGRYWHEQTPTYNVNGEQKKLPEGEYLPDTMQKFAADFIQRHKSERFFLYYSLSHLHAPIVRTPDTKNGESADQLYQDNVEYMDKLVGQVVQELERNGLRGTTLLVFTGDNGTAKFGEQAATVDGKPISGMKGSMFEGGSRVPLVVNWPGVTPAGKVNNDLTDFSDFFVTFADFAGAKLPNGVKLDGHSFAPQIRGEKGTPREWVYVELNGNSYVRDARYKLTGSGKMFDLAEAPFKETSVPKDTSDTTAQAARESLSAVLADHKAAPANPKSPLKKARSRLRKAVKAN
jgi:arylsulfatase A